MDEGNSFVYGDGGVHAERTRHQFYFIIGVSCYDVTTLVAVELNLLLIARVCVCVCLCVYTCQEIISTEHNDVYL